jgi:drug/metabolite transporter (DMT)-like permease
VALFGAALAPALLAWGLQRAGATVGSLLLNLEAVFTILLARAFYREPIGLRVAAAVTLMTAAATVLAVTSTGTGVFAGAAWAHWPSAAPRWPGRWTTR